MVWRKKRKKTCHCNSRAHFVKMRRLKTSSIPHFNIGKDTPRVWRVRSSNFLAISDFSPPNCFHLIFSAFLQATGRPFWFFRIFEMYENSLKATLSILEKFWVGRGSETFLSCYSWRSSTTFRLQRPTICTEKVNSFPFMFVLYA